jgi:hypothetical protein
MDKTLSLSEPLFLVGSERSGTTVLRIMLKHHPEIAWCNEFEYAVDQMSDLGQFPTLESYYEWLETHRIFQATGFKIDKTLSYPELIESFMGQMRDHNGKPIIGATVHRHFDRVLHIWPDARFIHLVRDPRDVARSCIGMGWAGNVWTGVRRWLEAEQLWNQIKQQIIPENRWIEITYESLISDPVETLTHLCEFIGVPYDSGMLDYSQTSTYDLPDAKYIGQWQRKMSDYEIQLVESRARDLLVERGYELSGLPPLNITPVMEKQLKIQDWWKRLQFRIKRYGYRLWAQDYVARHLGFKERAKQLQLQINSIDASYLM